MRLDLYLVEHSFAESRARAQELIRGGQVLVNGEAVAKASKTISPDDEINLQGRVHDYVSRGALKLEAALRNFEVTPEGETCLDLGASTGGFTEVLLRQNATKVYAVDVGHGQLHQRIDQDPRVINLEKTHAKDLSLQLIPDPIGLLVTDVSFISLKKALPGALALCASGAELCALIKPQFEVGPAEIGRGGLVKESHENSIGVAEDIAAWLRDQGWSVKGYIDSPIKGGDGNREFLIGATKEK